MKKINLAISIFLNICSFTSSTSISNFNIEILTSTINTTNTTNNNISLSSSPSSELPCIFACISCSNGICYACQPGYNLSYGTCIIASFCPSNCAGCYSNGLCYNCNSGYTLTSSNVCINNIAVMVLTIMGLVFLIIFLACCRAHLCAKKNRTEAASSHTQANDSQINKVIIRKSIPSQIVDSTSAESEYIPPPIYQNIESQPPINENQLQFNESENQIYYPPEECRNDYQKCYPNILENDAPIDTGMHMSVTITINKSKILYSQMQFL